LALTLSTIFFILINLAISPFYILMVALPRWKNTRKIMESLWPIVLPVIIYLFFISAIIALLRPDVIGLWKSLYLETGMFSKNAIELLSRLYGNYPEYTTLHGWVHIVIGDMFMARWAYLDAIDRNIESWKIGIVSILIVFMGPIGVGCYLLIRKRWIH